MSCDWNGKTRDCVTQQLVQHQRTYFVLLCRCLQQSYLQLRALHVVRQNSNSLLRNDFPSIHRCCGSVCMCNSTNLSSWPRKQSINCTGDSILLNRVRVTGEWNIILIGAVDLHTFYGSSSISEWFNWIATQLQHHYTMQGYPIHRLQTKWVREHFQLKFSSQFHSFYFVFTSNSASTPQSQWMCIVLYQFMMLVDPDKTTKNITSPNHTSVMRTVRDDVTDWWARDVT